MIAMTVPRLTASPEFVYSLPSRSAAIIAILFYCRPNCFPLLLHHLPPVHLSQQKLVFVCPLFFLPLSVIAGPRLLLLPSLSADSFLI